MALTAYQVKNYKPDPDKDIWVSDQYGLRLLIRKQGGKYWRLKYRFQGKQKTLALGVFPAVSLKDARDEAIKAKLLLAKGIDPSVKRSQEKKGLYGDYQNSLRTIAYEWWQMQSGGWSEDHSQRVWKRLEDNVLSQIGDMSIKDVKPMDLLPHLRAVEERGAFDAAKRVAQALSAIGRYAVQTGRVDYNPAADLSEVLRVRKRSHQPSLPRKELPVFLKALDDYDKRGRLLTKLAIELLVLTFVRPGELRGARWDEFDFEKKVWRIPAERMKMGTDHLVPLSTQALNIIEQIRPLSGQYALVFPSEKNRDEPMSDNTMRRAIHKLGFDGTVKGRSKAAPHGFRATASSILNEEQFNPDAIERQLSHQERNGVRAAYIHHAQYLDERTRMMQWWADHLDQLKSGDGVASS